MPSSKGRITHIRRGGKVQVRFQQVQKPTTTNWVKLDLTLENNPYCMFRSFNVHQKMNESHVNLSNKSTLVFYNWL